VGIKDVIKTEVRYVIAARVGSYSAGKSKWIFETKFAHKDEFDHFYEWKTWSRATVFADETTALKKWRYLVKKNPPAPGLHTRPANIRVIRVTMHPQIEQVYPTPNIIDSVGALAVGLELEEVTS
jgi:hypothetical protein